MILGKNLLNRYGTGLGTPECWIYNFINDIDKMFIWRIILFSSVLFLYAGIIVQSQISVFHFRDLGWILVSFNDNRSIPHSWGCLADVYRARHTHCTRVLSQFVVLLSTATGGYTGDRDPSAVISGHYFFLAFWHFRLILLCYFLFVRRRERVDRFPYWKQQHQKTRRRRDAESTRTSLDKTGVTVAGRQHKRCPPTMPAAELYREGEWWIYRRRRILSVYLYFSLNLLRTG